MRVLRSYGVKDDPSTIISWTRFRQLSPLLEKKSDSELMEQLYCVLSMCTKQLGNQMSTVDLQRAMKVPVPCRLVRSGCESICDDVNGSKVEIQGEGLDTTALAKNDVVPIALR